MAEFTGSNEKDISVGEPIVFENKTECKFEVCAGVVFHKSGVYEVSIVGNRTIVSEVPKRKTGKWVRYDGDWFKTMFKCSECGAMIDINEKYRNFFCYHCGARMDGEQE